MRKSKELSPEAAFERGLPNAKESEQVMLAQMIAGHLEPSIVFAEISPSQFYNSQYRMLAEIIRDLDRDGMAPDPSMVYQTGIAQGRAEAVSEAMFGLADIPKSVKWRQHCDRVRNAYVMRGLHETLSALSVLALDQNEDSDAIFARAQMLLEGLQGESRPRYDDLEHPEATARRENLSLYDWANPKVRNPLCPIPFAGMREFFDGVRGGEFCIIGA